MTSRFVPALALISLTLTQSVTLANDIEKVMNKTLGSSKSKLLKQAEGLAKSKLGLSGNKTPAATGATATGAAAGTAATGAATGTAATGAAAGTAATGAATGTAGAPKPPMSLTDKLKHRAQVESSKYAKKYGDRLMKQGENQVNKILH